MVGTFLEPSRGRRLKPIHSIPYSVAQPLERGSNNYYSIIQGGKDRLVPVHNSVIEYLRSYSAQLPDEREWFFPSACGHYSIKTIYDNFRELLFACNIPHTGNGPRVHDFRHTFAVHTLEKQLSDGYDPMVIVPRLAAYLGHKSYRETCWYIHLTVASFPELSQKLDRAFVGIIPVGGETDEEN